MSVDMIHRRPVYIFKAIWRAGALCNILHPSLLLFLSTLEILNVFLRVFPSPGLEQGERDHLRNQTSGEVFTKKTPNNLVLCFQQDFHTCDALHWASSRERCGQLPVPWGFGDAWCNYALPPWKDCRCCCCCRQPPFPPDPEPLLPASPSADGLKGAIWPRRWGSPSLPASFWADLKVCVPGLENLPYPQSRLKPTAAIQVLPGNPAEDARTRCTRARALTSRSVWSCLLHAST